MRRSTAVRLFAMHLATEDVIVCGLGSTRRAWIEQRAPQLTYNASDPMGMGPALALGLAIARPALRIVLLEGDGDLSMNLGVLLTIAGTAPTNLRIAVFVNDRYETGGGQPLPNAGHVSLARIAAAAGWPWSAEAGDEREAEVLVKELLAPDRLGLLTLKIDAEPSPYSADPDPTSQAEDRAAFQRRLTDGD